MGYWRNINTTKKLQSILIFIIIFYFFLYLRVLSLWIKLYYDGFQNQSNFREKKEIY